LRSEPEWVAEGAEASRTRLRQLSASDGLIFLPPRSDTA
jgi:hypothetical protein